MSVRFGYIVMEKKSRLNFIKITTQPQQTSSVYLCRKKNTSFDVGETDCVHKSNLFKLLRHFPYSFFIHIPNRTEHGCLPYIFSLFMRRKI